MYGENTLIGKISKGEVPTKEVKTRAGTFTIKYPTGTDFRTIAIKVSAALNGLPLSSFLESHIYIVRRDATLAVSIVKYPAGFPSDMQGDGICDYPDEEVKNSVYTEFGTFYKESQESISGNAGADTREPELGLTS